MERFSVVKIGLILVFVFLTLVFLNWNGSTNVNVKSLEMWKENVLSRVNAMELTKGEVTDKENPQYNEALNVIQKQRNEISTLLNEMRKKVGQMQCEKKGGRTNEQGGWCKSASTEKGGSHLTDSKFIPVLSNFLKGKKVASFGDGPGAYKREILKLGEVAGYEAYDGAPYCQETSEGRVKFLDLSVPQYGLPVYDWVMSLEVAEHIPRQYEAVYLDNIFRHAKEGIILSWAVPGQGGLDHINNRPLDYVIDVMKSNGFEIDLEKSKILQKGSSLDWLKRNTHVYIRSNTPRTQFNYYV